MRVGFFTQNSLKGGLDTFLVNLLSGWIGEDELVLFCNMSHPGLSDLRARLPSSIHIVPYDFLIAQDLPKKLDKFPKFIRFFLKVIFWALGFQYVTYRVKSLLASYKCERLLVVNGGYPGGDACLAASIAWAKLPGDHPRSWHNYHNLALPYSSTLLRRFKERWIDLLVGNAVNGFVTVSGACLNTLSVRTSLKKLNNNFIYNGINLPEVVNILPLRDELGLPIDAKLVLMLAVFDERKGHHFLFDAMRNVLEENLQAWLLVCGDGCERGRDLVRGLHKFHPYRDRILLMDYRSDIPNLLSQVDILVVPSQSQESFGYSALEAMWFGVPVVSTDVGGLPELVEHGKTGFIVAKHDVLSFSRAITLLLDNSELSKNFGSAAKVLAREKFSALYMTSQYENLLKAPK